MSVQILYLFFKSFGIALYEFFIILDIGPLSDIWFTNIFSHLIDYLLILLMVSFAV